MVSEVMVLDAPFAQLPEESRARQAASRAYYAGYHAVLDALRARLNKPDYKVNHRALIGWMRKARSFKLRALGDQLESARQMRSRSDYDMTGTVSKREAAIQLTTVKKSFIESRAELTRLVKDEQSEPPPSGSGFN